MNWKSACLTVVATSTLALTACGNNGNETGQGLNDGVQQTRFNNATDFPTENHGEYMTNNETRNPRNGIDNYGANRGAYDGAVRENDLRRDGVNNRNINNQANINDRNTQTNNNGNTTRNDENNFEVADDAAERITEQVDEVGSAYVLTTDNNAYVAVELDRTTDNNGKNAQNGGNGDNVSDQIEKRISRAVKDVNNDIENVYVSTNPDFVNLTNNYADNVNNDQPIEGFFQQFGEMIERVFPQAR
ncbi:YhcN/YlaJ family sporulation lipoprotein [Aquibacillus rhizosphaerae]|uniref:YhcN/YlaJ family sporulation lipoprotein n=1 Tax=Aquibacillus rhizosphaerae TaxID=3051431 RepID=A0ABT7L3K3_9BACI|nr:YhcN/YlaJ family sporulation lipoprotein [Aquibacillus sp. LR5S19]MDL4840429.1 YhcN/YlaJ family sporulation lipoprotein [Aquibacillus sp. LR5S19]